MAPARAPIFHPLAALRHSAAASPYQQRVAAPHYREIAIELRNGYGELLKELSEKVVLQRKAHGTRKSVLATPAWVSSPANPPAATPPVPSASKKSAPV